MSAYAAVNEAFQMAKTQNLLLREVLSDRAARKSQAKAESAKDDAKLVTEAAPHEKT